LWRCINYSFILLLVWRFIVCEVILHSEHDTHFWTQSLVPNLAAFCDQLNTFAEIVHRTYLLLTLVAHFVPHLIQINALIVFIFQQENASIMKDSSVLIYVLIYVHG
jgi:hypothetical protein